MTISTQLRPSLDRPDLDRKIKPRQGRPRWSPLWDRCWLCGTTEFPHRGRGLCGLCYVRLRFLRRLPPLADYVVEGGRNNGAWSRGYDACRMCGTTQQAHHARGLCARCYMRRLRNALDGHPDEESYVSVEVDGLAEEEPLAEAVPTGILLP